MRSFSLSTGGDSEASEELPHCKLFNLLRMKGIQLPIKQKSFSHEKLFLVQAGRLELPHLAALDPKSSVSTNSTTPALDPKLSGCKYKQ